MSTRISRRRLLTIAAATAGLSLSRAAWASAAEAPAIFQAHGSALGAATTIALVQEDVARARRVVRLCFAEVERLERIFSLYRADSALVTLNREGRLNAPPAELVELLTGAQHFGALSGGAFDVTVQPLWLLYARHFADTKADPNGPDRRAIAQALALVDYRRLAVGTRRITLGGPGMAITLNGIAQGYITDRIAALLMEEGFHDVLLDLGEIRAAGRPPGRDGWPVGLRDPAQPEAIFETLALNGQAVASSGGYGCMFEPSGHHHHLFDPKTGRSAAICRGVSVIADRATLADALSTTFSVLPPDRAAPLARSVGARRVIYTLADGSRRMLNL